MKRLIILCGLIGSGKTTFSLNNGFQFTDYDQIEGFSTKKMQIEWTERLLGTHDEVCHITTYPTREEVTKLSKYNPNYVWLDTSLDQCKTNILIRNRKRDMENLFSVFEANQDMLFKFKKTKIPFKVVRVFN